MSPANRRPLTPSRFEWDEGPKSSLPDSSSADSPVGLPPVTASNISFRTTRPSKASPTAVMPEMMRTLHRRIAHAEKRCGSPHASAAWATKQNPRRGPSGSNPRARIWGYEERLIRGLRRSLQPWGQYRRPAADYCFDQGARTKAASTRCVDLAKGTSLAFPGCESCFVPRIMRDADQGAGMFVDAPRSGGVGERECFGELADLKQALDRAGAGDDHEADVLPDRALLKLDRHVKAA